VFQLYTRTPLTEFIVSVCLFIQLLDDDLVEVETCRKGVSHKRLFTTACVICCLKYCIINILHGTRSTLNMLLCLLQYSNVKANLLLGGAESVTRASRFTFEECTPVSSRYVAEWALRPV